MDDYIKQAYDPDHFRAQGHQMIDLLADYLKQLQLVEEHPYFELATSPECNIVCFRYVPSGEHDLEHLNQVNEKIRQHLLEEGTFYIVKTNLEGALWLRCTFTNPFTTEEDLLSLLRSIK